MTPIEHLQDGSALPRHSPRPAEILQTRPKSTNETIVYAILGITLASLLLYMTWICALFVVDANPRKDELPPVHHIIGDGIGRLTDLRDSSVYNTIQIGQNWISEPMRWQRQSWVNETEWYSQTEASSACPLGWYFITLAELSGLVEKYQNEEEGKFPSPAEQGEMWRKLIRNKQGFDLIDPTQRIPQRLILLTSTRYEINQSMVYAFELKTLRQDTTVRLIPIPQSSKGLCLCAQSKN